MKLRITTAFAVAAAMAVAVFALFTACESVSLEEAVPQAKLLSLSITTSADKVIEVSGIPAPIPGFEWDDEEYEVAGADFGTIPVKTAAETEEVRLNVRISAGAVVRWGIARAGNRPDRFDDPRAPASFDTRDFLYFKVTADDGETSNYYRFYSVLASPVKELAAIAIAGRDPNEIVIGEGNNATKFKVPLPTKYPSDDPDDPWKDVKNDIANQRFRGRIDITRREASLGSLVVSEPQDKTAKIRYAVADTYTAGRNGQFGEFTETVERVIKDEQEKDVFQAVDTLTFADGNVLLVEVTAQNEADTNYYLFDVTAGQLATIAKLEFDGVEVVGKGTQHGQWPSVTPGNFDSADQQAGGFRINIALDDPEGDFAYAVIANKGAAAPGGYGKDSTVLFNDKQTLAIRVQSARQTLGEYTGTADTRYYKVEVNLLAANFLTQPKSAAYTVQSHTLTGRVLISDTPTAVTLADGPIAPLSVEIDRPATGFTYQWYTANSWYGGYGFDKDGRIAGDAGFIYDAYHPTTGKNPSGLDEKNNVSLHNGGNEFYRLPFDGDPIPGATQETYTPVINSNNRPFLASFTNQTQYYWVVITDPAGKKATSKRAAIVTEWNEEWNMGTPIGKKTDKKHYIVDLYAYLDKSGNTPGLQGNPRNATPFKAGNHGDKYLIPMKFPDGFNIMDYSVVTCQAYFFLADGRAWIQNWTQGDFGFEKDGEKLVLWYNLTNDNATRGLAGSGNEPQGSGLTTIPSHLVVQPAGTSPIKEMPPFTPAGVPDKDEIEKMGKTAQGWFNPYIEIVELRFEGPARY